MQTLKYYLFLFLLVLSVHYAFAFEPANGNPKYQAYIERYKDAAIAEMLKWRIPASITLAQGLLESGAGQSELSRKGNNHFGIKCHGWAGRKTYHDDDESQECFRAYDDPFDSYEDHSRFLAESSRYRQLFSLSIYDYKGWAKGLKACGYATSPTYASSLIRIIETYGLDKYDRAKTYNHAMVRNGGNISVSSPSNIFAQHHNTGKLNHDIKINNRRFYIIAKSGDTFKSLSKELDISARKLAKYNEKKKKDSIKAGDIIYLQKKRTKADKLFKRQPHVVKSGESLYDIAQNYGVQLKKLIKKNKMTDDYSVKVGDKIRVY